MASESLIDEWSRVYRDYTDDEGQAVGTLAFVVWMLIFVSMFALGSMVNVMCRLYDAIANHKACIQIIGIGL